MDRRGTILGFDQGMEQLTGWPAVEVVGRNKSLGGPLVPDQAAGRPRVLLTASILSLLLNAGFSTTLLWQVGFLGPSIGTALSFVCTIGFYCWGIGRAAGLPLHRVFPLARYGRILATASIGAAVLWLCKAQMPSVAALRIGVVAIGILTTFGVLGTVTRLISREDWEFVTQWLRGRRLDVQ